MQTHHHSRSLPYPSLHSHRFTCAEREAIDAIFTRRPFDVALAEEAFALAACDFDLERDDRHRIDRARRAVLVGLATQTRVTSRDVEYAADWLAHVLVDLGLVDGEVTALFDVIGLPMDAVPRVRSRARGLAPPPRVLALAVVASALVADRVRVYHQLAA